MKNQKAFTLVELVIVIIILGILSATALPRFVNLTSDAKIASMKATFGALKAANTLVNLKALTQGKSDGSSVYISIDSSTGLGLKYGYPFPYAVDNVAKSVSSSTNEATDSVVMLKGLVPDLEVSTGTDSIYQVTWSPMVGNVSGKMIITYLKANSSSPSDESQTTGCNFVYMPPGYVAPTGPVIAPSYAIYTGGC